ncbi:hypothetical protein KVR01_006292 [Diaporthe batatas]|uniref:uncharacterized protein n=1 Tax=Diaporthe batatas TaxID=748121 RepID=UPI001D03C37D|nr:uncharacterized protein KVR01_006292 [Diaporthe batatas]KAG8164374.1 hypothetical protein KVR01_006292 [Diaporthe batatas]
MPNQPYRELAQRADGPYRQLPIEQLVDTRLCVSSLTPQQCREVMMQLDDRQIKNAVYDRTLCFPHDQWTQNIRAIYGQQVEHDTEVVTSFENMTAHMEALFATWNNVVAFQPEDLDNFDAHVKSYLCPSIDNIGVYGTYSRHNATKVNALSSLLQIGQLIVAIPLLTSQRGVAMFEYDALSRAVGNVLCSAPNDAIRKQIFSPEVEAGYLKLVEKANESGIFSGLHQALAPGAQVYAYTVPRGDLLIPYRGQQPAFSQPALSQPASAPKAKKRKVSAGSKASASPGTPNNPFSRPSSAGAGPIGMPPFAQAAYSNAAATQTGGVQVKQEQPQQVEQQPQQVEEQPQQVVVQPQQVEGQAQPGEEGGAKQGQEPKAVPTPLDEMLRSIEDAIFHAQPGEEPEEQLKRAPGVTALINRTATTILKQFQAAAADCGEQGRRDVFTRSLEDTAFAILWIFESCAVNMGGTVLSAEVSRTISRTTLVGALWGAVRLATAAEFGDLLKAETHAETFGDKLERIIKRLDEEGVLGFGDLRMVLANMRAGVALPEQGPALPIDPRLK